jgi:Fungal specific transcription factor domain
MVDITDCRDLTSIQTVAIMILFLQSTANLSTCYGYIGIALRACCRLGLHRNITANFNAIEIEERKRLFWLVRKMDAYVGAMLGLPQMLGDEDIDQDLPAEVDDDYIFEYGLRPMPSTEFSLMKATNAHTKLTDILRKVVRYIYPIKGLGDVHSGESYSISQNRLRELECDLQQWMDDLPMELRPSENSSAELSRWVDPFTSSDAANINRVQQLLRMSYAHVQMMMYRPFIHYVSQPYSAGKVDKRSFACAAACVSVARNIVHITTEMKKRGLLVGAYWFVMYTTYFAILSLIFFVLEDPESPTCKDILKDAMEGKDTLASLAKRSLAADRCTASLTVCLILIAARAAYADMYGRASSRAFPRSSTSDVYSSAQRPPQPRKRGRLPARRHSHKATTMSQILVCHGVFERVLVPREPGPCRMTTSPRSPNETPCRIRLCSLPLAFSQALHHPHGRRNQTSSTVAAHPPRKTHRCLAKRTIARLLETLTSRT